jgi:hypothetical protein
MALILSEPFYLTLWPIRDEHLIHQSVLIPSLSSWRMTNRGTSPRGSGSGAVEPVPVPHVERCPPPQRKQKHSTAQQHTPSLTRDGATYLALFLNSCLEPTARLQITASSAILLSSCSRLHLDICSLLDLIELLATSATSRSALSTPG